jgi:hypothetical protein
MKFFRGLFKLLAACIIILAVFFPVAVFVHEATHYLMYTMEGIPVTSLHVLDSDSLQNGRLGFVTTAKESQFSALFNEGIANTIGYLFIAAILLVILVVPFKTFTVHQLESMGLKSNTSHCSVPSL